MSKRHDGFVLELPIAEAMTVIRRLVAQSDWLIMELESTSLICKEVTPTLIQFHWAATMKVQLSKLNDDHTQVELQGSIWSFGPIQSGHLKGKMGQLRNQIEIAAMTCAV